MTKKRNKWIILLVSLCMCMTFLTFIPYKQALVFKYEDTDDILAYIPLSKGQTFKIQYTHSIHLSEVIESYKITQNNSIQQYELCYEDFAIGMPSHAAEGEIFESIDGKYSIKNMRTILPYFDLRVGRVVANHRIIHHEQSYELSRFIDKGTWVRIQMQELNILQLLKGVNILGSKE